MSYNPSVKVYYISPNDGGPSENNRLVPAPKINIKQEPIYANDTIIGYSHVISFNGYCTSLDLRNVISGQIYDFDDTVSAIDKFKSIIGSNGGTLLVVDSNNTEILKATGGIVRTVTINESNNQWVNYAPYSAEIDFNELWLGDCDGIVQKDCGEIFDGLTESPYLLDMKKFRIKSFKDSFSIDLSEDTMYNSFSLGSLQLNNQHFIIKYTINATGKHYFSHNFKLMPAWEQAKRFVQYKLIEQIKNRLTVDFMQRASDGCSPVSDLGDLYKPGSPGLLSDINLNGDFKIYNETVSCDVSESEGSFSATYNAILKRNNASTNSSVLHTITKSTNTSYDDAGKKTIDIKINGNIQGLIETGLLKNSNILELPNNGSFFAYNDSSTNSRYSQALLGFNDIATKEDLKDSIKTFFGINHQALGLSGECISPTGLPQPVSHVISHSYVEGSINYNTSYNSDASCSPSGVSFTNISIGLEDSIDVIAEFIIPGRQKGPIIQKIGSKTPKKITLNIDGTLPNKKCCYDLSNNEVYVTICSGLPLPSGITGSNIENMKLTQDQFVFNPIDGSYSISREYLTCCSGI